MRVVSSLARSLACCSCLLLLVSACVCVYCFYLSVFASVWRVPKAFLTTSHMQRGGSLVAGGSLNLCSEGLGGLGGFGACSLNAPEVNLVISQKADGKKRMVL